MKRSLLLLALIPALWGSLSFGQGKTPANLISVSTNDFQTFDLTESLYDTSAPTSRVYGTVQHVFDWMDDHWYDGTVDTNLWGFIKPATNSTQAVFDFMDLWFASFAATTNDGLLKGTNIVGAVYNPTTRVWTVDSQTAGLMSGTNIYGFTYNPTTLTWTAVADTNETPELTNGVWFVAVNTNSFAPPSNAFSLVYGYTSAAGTGFSSADGTFTPPKNGLYAFYYGFGLNPYSDNVSVKEHSAYVCLTNTTPLAPSTNGPVSTNWLSVTVAGNEGNARYSGSGLLRLTTNDVVGLKVWASWPSAPVSAAFYKGVHFQGVWVSE